MKPVRVSQLNAYVRRVLSSDPILGNLSVVGEVSNFKLHSNGHVYFSLKDEKAKVNCFLPGDVYAGLSCAIGDGVEVIATGYISVYERGGTYSLNVRALDVSGSGDLAMAFERLKAKLAGEGLFDPAQKRPLPVFPGAIAIVTSNTGAAIEDMLKILTRKNDVVDILVYPTLVQGPMAAAQIAEGIAQINAHHPDVDVIIIGRGGGSAEELWAFNEEVVARAIYASEIPVISAVGHETDFTISDLVADIRAETPTAAAEMAAPDMTEIRAALTYAMERLTEGLYGRTDRVRMRMDACAMPQLYRVLSGRIDRSRADVDRLFLDAARDAKDLVTERTHAVERVFGTLSAADPKRIMARGYAALTSGGRPVRSVRDVEAGDAVEAVLKDGRAALTVDAIRAADAD